MYFLYFSKIYSPFPIVPEITVASNLFVVSFSPYMSLYKWTTHIACNGFKSDNFKETFTTAGSVLSRSCKKISLTNHRLYLLLMKAVTILFTENAWIKIKFFKSFGTILKSHPFFCHQSPSISLYVC